MTQQSIIKDFLITELQTIEKKNNSNTITLFKKSQKTLPKEFQQEKCAVIFFCLFLQEIIK